MVGYERGRCVSLPVPHEISGLGLSCCNLAREKKRLHKSDEQQVKRGCVNDDVRGCEKMV